MLRVTDLSKAADMLTTVRPGGTLTRPTVAGARRARRTRLVKSSRVLWCS